MLRLNGPAPRARPRPARVPIPGGAIEAVVAGDGPALLALHGGMGGWDQSWLLAAALLCDDPAFRVVAVSRPGYLGTPLALGSSPDAAADRLAALLDALGINRAVVAAVSAGGPTALTFAARHPDRVSALILVSTATGTLEVTPQIAERLRQFRRLAAIPGVTAAMGLAMRLTWAKAAARSIADPAQRAATLADPEAGPLFRALLDQTSRRIAERLPGTLNDTGVLQDLTLPLDAVRAPVLSLHGDADRIVPFDHSDRLVAAIAGTERLVLPDGGHTALFTHRAMIRDRVATFLARHAD